MMARGGTGECGGRIRWIVWVDTGGWPVLGLRGSGMHLEGLRKTTRLGGGGTVCPEAEVHGSWLLRVVAIACL